MILSTIIGKETYLIYLCIMAATKKIKMEPENGLAMIRAINALYRLITFIGKKPKINTKYKRREFTGQDTGHGPIEDICSKTKVTLFIIINLKSLNICLKHHCNYYYLQAIRKDLFRDVLK